MKGTDRLHIVLVVLLTLGALCTGCGYPDQIAALEAQLAQSEDELQSTRDALHEAQSDVSEKEDSLTILTRDFEVLQSVASEKDSTIAELTEQVSTLEEENEFLRLPPPETVKGEVAGYISLERTRELYDNWLPLAGGSLSAKARGPYALATLATLKAFLEENHVDSFPPLGRQNKSDYGDIAAYLLKDAWDASNLPGWSLGLAKVEETHPYYGPNTVWQNIFLTQEDGEYVFYEVDPRRDTATKMEKPSERYKQVLIVGNGFFSR